MVRGLRLADGREVVVKIRPPSPRLAACVEVQRRLFEAGYPCPEPLTAPTPLNHAPTAPTTNPTEVATAEVFVGGGAELPRSDPSRAFAEAFARLIDVAPRSDEVGTLDPPPSWADWNHDGDGLWPHPEEDPDIDLDAVTGAEWIDDAARRARDRLRAANVNEAAQHGASTGNAADATDGADGADGAGTGNATDGADGADGAGGAGGADGADGADGDDGAGAEGAGTVIGHCDWLAANLRWDGDELLVVHDWDSVVADAEPVLVGFAAALHSTRAATEPATVEDTERLRSGYCRRRQHNPHEREGGGAPGLWTSAYDAKLQHALGQAVTSLSEHEARERLRRSGADPGRN